MTPHEQDLLPKQIAALIEGEPNAIANLANVAALLFQELADVNWVGFYLLEGAGCKEVAVRLRLSPNTVRSHLNSLMAKFEVHSTLELVALTRPRLEALREDRQLRTSAKSSGAGSSRPSRTERDPVRARWRDPAGVDEEAAGGAGEGLVPRATRASPYGTAGTRLPSQSE